MENTLDSMRIEENLYDSFKRVKSDILRLNDRINTLPASFGKVKDDYGKLRADAKALRDDHIKMRAAMDFLTKRVEYLESAVERLSPSRQDKLSPARVRSANKKPRKATK